MEFKQLEAFVQVVKLGSFSKAAKKLYLTQPTISAHISSLEKELDTRLIVRTPKEAFASETGRILYEYAQRILDMRDAAIAECLTKRAQLSGTIRIASSSIPYQYVLPKLMQVFRSRNPSVAFSVIRSDSGGVAEAIRENQAQIGLAGSIMDESVCLYTEFMDDSLVVATPNAPPFNQFRDGPFRLGNLLQHPFLLREPGSGTRKEAEAFLRKNGLEPHRLNVVAQLDNPETILQSVSLGLGITILSHLSCADFQRDGKIRVFQPEGGPIRRKLYLLRRRDAALPDNATAFLQFVEEERLL